jgi:hypothetical protein
MRDLVERRSAVKVGIIVAVCEDCGTSSGQPHKVHNRQVLQA